VQAIIALASTQTLALVTSHLALTRECHREGNGRVILVIAQMQMPVSWGSRKGNICDKPGAIRAEIWRVKGLTLAFWGPGLAR
jgi:hypothetical protein